MVWAPQAGSRNHFSAEKWNLRVLSLKFLWRQNHFSTMDFAQLPPWSKANGVPLPLLKAKK
jgi:hypothetical protein